MKILFLSVVIVAAISGVSSVYQSHSDWIATTAVTIFFWPVIMMILMVIMGKNLGTYDAVKMQNFYNLDAMRRNSDQAARNNQPWQKKY